LPWKIGEMRGKLFAKREVFAESPAFGADFLDREDFADSSRLSLRDLATIMQCRLASS
jgi:hypothetical protein